MRCTSFFIVGFLGVLVALGITTLFSVDYGAAKLNTEYDYIIVGSGSAGAIVAARLSEDPSVSVLLLEAGPDYDGLFVRAPAGSALLQNIPTDWKFRSTKQDEACKGLVNEQMSIPQGRMLGGSSQMNYMAYVRGNKADYDNIAKKTGEDAWTYENILPLFKRSENMMIPELRKSKYHGLGGEVAIDYAKSNVSATRASIQSLVDIGLKFNPDYNGEEQMGVGQTQINARDSVRQSTAIAFLRKLTARKNLHISTESLVGKVILNDKAADQAAVAVQFTRRGQAFEISAKKEIIISAGSFRTPQLLMLSGIGPKQHLEEMGIKVLVDSPGVGQNLQDHIGAGWPYTIGRPQSPAQRDSVTTAWAESLWSLLSYFTDGSGPLATNGLEVTGFLSTGLHDDLPKTVPDVQVHVLVAGPNPQLNQNLGLRPEWGIPMGPAGPDTPGLMYVAYLLHPKSRGEVRLASKDPADNPRINPNYLKHPLDRTILMEGLKWLRKAKDSPAMKEYNLTFFRRAAQPPECSQHSEFSDEWILCEIKYFAVTIYHPVGTAAMGSVLDGQLRVQGVKNLRVADLSIYPDEISGNTQAAAMLAGEMAAAFIRGKK